MQQQKKRWPLAAAAAQAILKLLPLPRRKRLTVKILQLMEEWRLVG
jgi:hypothetical protein